MHSFTRERLTGLWVSAYYMNDRSWPPHGATMIAEGVTPVKELYTGKKEYAYIVPKGLARFFYLMRFQRSDQAIHEAYELSDSAQFEACVLIGLQGSRA